MNLDIITEMASIKNFISEKYPNTRIILQNVPAQPAPDTLVIRFQGDSRDAETPFHMLSEREYQIIYFNERAPDVLAKMDGLSRGFLYGRTVIPIRNSLRYIRIARFGFGQIFKTEHADLEACIGVLQTEVRETRDRETFDKIMKVYAKYE